LPEKPDWGYLTCRPGKVYLIVKDWPAAGKSLTLPALKRRPVRAYLLNDAGKRGSSTFVMGKRIEGGRGMG
jgi:hypothetical protein